MHKYLIFNIDNVCTGVFDEEVENSIAYDYDPTKQWFPTIQLIDGVVTHTMAGVSVANQEKRFNAAKEAEDFQKYKLSRVSVIKSSAARLISEMDWKVERAKEQDQLENTTDKFLYIAVIGALVFSLLIELYYEGVFGHWLA